MKGAYAEEAGQERLVVDTHVLIWLMFGDARLGKQTRGRIDLATKTGELLVSAITPWEIGVLTSKKRIDLQRDVLVWVRDTLALPGIALIALEPEIAVASTRLPFAMHPDPADRILVATARHLGATLVTADHALLRVAKKGYFRALDATA
ncbi:MAG: type II toxin-antitoxin system VapC family toxin [Acidobacteriota bacterium]